MKQEAVDRFVYSVDPNKYEIIEYIRNENPDKKKIIKKLKKYNDPVIPFIKEHIYDNFEKFDNEIICEIIDDLFMNFRENMMLNMENFGKTPRGFKQSLRKWKKNNFDCYKFIS